jgi:hypothetical protein
MHQPGIEDRHLAGFQQHISRPGLVNGGGIEDQANRRVLALGRVINVDMPNLTAMGAGDIPQAAVFRRTPVKRDPDAGGCPGFDRPMWRVLMPGDPLAGASRFAEDRGAPEDHARAHDLAHHGQDIRPLGDLQPDRVTVDSQRPIAGKVRADYAIAAGAPPILRPGNRPRSPREWPTRRRNATGCTGSTPPAPASASDAPRYAGARSAEIVHLLPARHRTPP